MSNTSALTSQGGTNSDTLRRMACLLSASTAAPLIFNLINMLQAALIARSSPLKLEIANIDLAIPSIISPFQFLISTASLPSPPPLGMATSQLALKQSLSRALQVDRSFWADGVSIWTLEISKKL
ncbi:hypothetical protein RHMOL_Rhmol01G0205600 [Rhododendron molle]|uniref:Uncharacterized protein n=1 Tax=Rhododendron molle TaxID=49168 RepID=A0ACC0Q577_RHOML|nr:hypothetical protein RHMOL_Rhmol01G0205600 [Rhododendron molle]